MSKRLHVKYPLLLSDFNEMWIFSTQILEKVANIKFHQNPSSGGRVVPCGQKDMKLIVAFRNFTNAPNNGRWKITDAVTGPYNIWQSRYMEPYSRRQGQSCSRQSRPVLSFIHLCILHNKIRNTHRSEHFRIGRIVTATSDNSNTGNS
jgi:hypothetical protein